MSEKEKWFACRLWINGSYCLNVLYLLSPSFLTQYKHYLIKILLITANLALVLQTQSPTTNHRPGERNRRVSNSILSTSSKIDIHLIKIYDVQALLKQNYCFFRKQVWRLHHHTFERQSQSFPHSITDVQIWTDHRGSPLTLLFMDFYNSRE